MNTSLATLPRITDYSAILRADLGTATRRKYIAAMRRLTQSNIDPFDNIALSDYAESLPMSIRAHTKSALSIIFHEYETFIKSNATPEHIGAVQAILYRLEAMDEAIQVSASKGKEMPIWLSALQVEQITSMPDRTTLRGRRDWIVLAVLLGAGLRREELAHLTFDQIKQQPVRDNKFRTVLSIKGKGDKSRTVPISPLLAAHLESWRQEVGGGFVARAITKSGTIKPNLNPESINQIVNHYGALIGKSELQAHDCRRTWAQLGLSAGVPITQISILLGHADVSTTQRYLDLSVDLDNSISDYVPLSGD